MTNRVMALGHLRRADPRLQTARFAREQGSWPFAVRQAQECRRFPEWFAKDVDLMAYRSRKLADDRERSMYGSEELGLPAQAVFGELDAREAVTAADETFAAVRRLVVGVGA